MAETASRGVAPPGEVTRGFFARVRASGKGEVGGGRRAEDRKRRAVGGNRPYRGAADPGRKRSCRGRRAGACWRAMKFLFLRWWVLLVAGVVGLPAQVVTYQFSGEVNFGSDKGEEPVTLFGSTESPLSFSATLTFDLTSNPAVLVVPTGGTFNGSEALNPFYVFSLASVSAAAVTVGTQTWGAGDIQVIDWAEATGSILSDTNLVTPPTLVFVRFIDGNGNRFDLGGTSGGGGVQLVNELFPVDGETGASGGGSFSISAVPEPSTYALLAGAGALVGCVVRARRRAVR